MKNKDNDKGNFKPCDAFLHITIIGKTPEDGSEPKVHRLQKGIPLFLDKKWEKALITAGEGKLDSLVANNKIVLDINLVTPDDDEDIEL